MKTGLVLEGGAMRGIYTAGVLDAFLEQDIKVDGVIGVSAGAVHGCSYVSGSARAQHPLLFEIYERSPVYEFPVTSEDG